MSDFRISTLQDLKRHSKAVGDHFFEARAGRMLRTVQVAGIYRQPYQAATEGYVVTVNEPEDSEAYAFIYRFEATAEALYWYPIDRSESLKDAEAFLNSMGATK